ncbi:MAG: recombinase RecT, partial [Gemmatimonadaceae bacterium]|nr:recombinase RecT [Gemmatimonadaceae bacterium]
MTATAALAVHTPADASTALAPVPDGSKLEALLSHPEAKARIGPLLSPGDDYERIVAVIGRASRKNPEILECTGTSILDAAATIVGWRLEIGETAYLVPFRDNDAGVKVCTPIMGYTGMAQLLIAAGAARYIEPWCVYWGEPFELFGGSESRIEHRPVEPAQRGKLRGAYVILHLRYNVRSFHWMPIEDIDAIRKAKSKKWKGGECPPWYAKKTVIRQMSKLLPKTREVARAFSFIQDEEARELGAADEVSLEAAEVTAAIAPPATAAPVSPAKPKEPPPLTLELALEMPLRGGADKWRGNGGKPLR